MRAAFISLLFPAILLIPTSVASQRGRPTEEIIIYRDRNFSGPAVSIERDQSNLRLNWNVGAARVNRGTWELCERPNFRGPCLTLSSSNANLGRRRVQSVRLVRPTARWGTLGSAEVGRLGWDRRVIRLRGDPRLTSVRFCAERNRVQIRAVRAIFANNRFQTLNVPAQIGRDQCTNALRLSGAPRNLSSVELSVSTTAAAARARVRLEGR